MPILWVDLGLGGTPAGSGTQTDPYSWGSAQSIINSVPSGPSDKEWRFKNGYTGPLRWVFRDYLSIDSWDGVSTWYLHITDGTGACALYGGAFTSGASVKRGRLTNEDREIDIISDYSLGQRHLVEECYIESTPLSTENDLGRIYLADSNTFGYHKFKNSTIVVPSGGISELVTNSTLTDYGADVIFDNCIVQVDTLDLLPTKDIFAIINGVFCKTKATWESSVLSLTVGNAPVFDYDDSYFTWPSASNGSASAFNAVNRVGVGAVWAYQEAQGGFAPSLASDGLILPGRAGYLSGYKFVVGTGNDDIVIRKEDTWSGGIGYNVYLCILPGTSDVLDGFINPYRDLTQDILLFAHTDPAGTEKTYPRSAFQNAVAGQEVVLRISETYPSGASTIFGEKFFTWYSGDPARNTTFHQGSIGTYWKTNLHTPGICRFAINPETEKFAVEDWNDGDYNELEGSGIVSGAIVEQISAREVLVPEPPKGDIFGTLIGSYHPHLDIVIDDRDVERDPTFETAILTSLFSNRRANPDDILRDNASDRQGWWGDEFSTFQGDRLGSRLWLLDRAKTVSEALARTEEYTGEALQWMKDDGIVSDLSVEVAREDDDIIRISLTLTRPRGANTLFYRYYFNWREQILRRS